MKTITTGTTLPRGSHYVEPLATGINIKPSDQDVLESGD